MYYRSLGQTGIEVSVIGLGCWQFAGEWAWGPQEEAASIATVQAALDHGITIFDTAEGYGSGRSEEILGKGLMGRRGEAVIATKVSERNLAPVDLKEACRRSLKALRTDYIDLYQIHWPNWDIPLADTVGALQSLQSEGLIRAYGVSNFGPRDLTDFIDIAGNCASNQLPYNLLWRSIEFEVQALCELHSTSILCYSPLAQGLLTGKFASPDDVPDGRARTRNFSDDRALARHGEAGFEAETFAAIDEIRQIAQDCGINMAELSLAWLLEQPAVTTVLVGGRNPSQVERNIKAGARILDAGVRDKLSQATDPLKVLLGPKIDPYQAVSRTR